MSEGTGVPDSASTDESRFVVTSDRGTLRYLNNAEVSPDALRIPGVMDTSGSSSSSRRSRRRGSLRRKTRRALWAGMLVVLVVVFLVFALV